jgi:hypothetical protein
MNLDARRIITERTLARYSGLPFSWRKRATCLHLAHFHLKAAKYKLPRIPAINNVLSAKSALNERGWENVADMLDAFCERIAPAAMMIGDLAVLKSDDDLGAILICAGAKCMGWNQDHAFIVPQEPLEYLGSWRI